MKCTNCGSDLPDEKIMFCGYCGHKLRSDPSPDAQKLDTPDLKPGKPSPAKPGGLLWKKWVWVLLAGIFLVFLLVVAVLVYLYFFVPGLVINL